MRFLALYQKINIISLRLDIIEYHSNTTFGEVKFLSPAGW